MKENPLLQIMQLILFPKFDKIEIKREKKFGGDLIFKKYEELEEAFAQKKLHPIDLKSASIEYLEKLISPIRNEYR